MHGNADITALISRANAGDKIAQANLGIQLFQTGRIQESVAWLEKAAIAEQLPAMNLLGVMYLNGLAVPLDMIRAAELLARAAELGLKEASYTLAGMYAAGFGVKPDSQNAWRYLIRACRGGHLPALRVAGLLQLLARSDDMHGVELLKLAAVHQDGLAQAILATWLSQPGPAQDLSQAGYWFGQASGRGMHTARNPAAGLPSASIAPALSLNPDWEQLEPVEFASSSTGEVRVLVPDVVYEIKEALPRLACEYLINLAAPRLRPSMVSDPQTGDYVSNPARSSHSMYFPPNMYDCAVAYIRKLMANLSALPESHAEPLSILRYTPGQEYKPHQDYFVGATVSDSHTERQGGQRAVTVFAYLSDVEQGGETEFPEYKLRVQAQLGKAVKFMNLCEDGTPNDKTLHAGCPVIKGEKWLATFWFRQRPFAWNV